MAIHTNSEAGKNTKKLFGALKGVFDGARDRKEKQDLESRISNLENNEGSKGPRR